MPSVMTAVISVAGPAPVEHRQQGFPVLGIHLVSRRILQILIQIFPVDGHHPLGIFFLLHAPFDFQGSHPRLKNLRKNIQCTDILQAERAQILPGSSKLLPFIGHLVGKAAGLGASAPISAPSSQYAAEQTLSGITVTQSPMDKSLNIKASRLPHGPQLFQRQLPGRHNPVHRPELLKKAHAGRPRHRHLCADVNRKPWKIILNKSKHTEILDNHRVQPCLIVRRQIIKKIPLHLPVLHECIHCQVQLLPTAVGMADCLDQFFLSKILCICPRPETAPSGIDCVRAGVQSRIKALQGTGRCQ